VERPLVERILPVGEITLAWLRECGKVTEAADGRWRDGAPALGAALVAALGVALAAALPRVPLSSAISSATTHKVLPITLRLSGQKLSRTDSRHLSVRLLPFTGPVKTVDFGTGTGPEG